MREILEVLIFTADGARSLKELRQVLPDLTPDIIDTLVKDLNRIYAESGRSFHIEAAADGYQFVTALTYTPYIKQLSQTLRLSQAALEVLSVIAYKGPCSKIEIETVRGVDSTSALKNLLKYELIDIKAGKPMQYYTTSHFLEVFGLRTLAELPDIKQFEDVLG